MKSYQQVEGMLYNHFEKVRSRDKYKSSLDRVRKRIKVIEQELSNCHFTLTTDIQGIDYSKDIITTSNDNSSSMERDLIREETKLEEELSREKRCKINIKRKIRNLQKQIDDVEIILEQIPLNYLEFIELIYKEKLTHRKIGMFTNCDSSTVSRNRTSVVNKLRELL